MNFLTLKGMNVTQADVDNIMLSAFRVLTYSIALLPHPFLTIFQRLGPFYVPN